MLFQQLWLATCLDNEFSCAGIFFTITSVTRIPASCGLSAQLLGYSGRHGVCNSIFSRCVSNEDCDVVWGIVSGNGGGSGQGHSVIPVGCAEGNDFSRVRVRTEERE